MFHLQSIILKQKDVCKSVFKTVIFHLSCIYAERGKNLSNVFYCIIYIAVRLSIAHLATIWRFLASTVVSVNKPRQAGRPHATPFSDDQSPAHTQLQSI